MHGALPLMPMRESAAKIFSALKVRLSSESMLREGRSFCGRLCKLLKYLLKYYYFLEK